MSKSIRVYAPATVANVSCAFDILGFAVRRPGDEVTAILSDEPGAVIEQIRGDGGALPLDSTQNTAAVAVSAFLKKIDASLGVKIELEKKMPLGSGLGSSAASAAAALHAANLLFGSPLTNRELVPFAMEAERAACGVAHADNVAPALLGGFVLIRSYDPLDIIGIEPPVELHCSIVHPIIEIRTKDSRKILKKDIPLTDAIIQWGNIAGLITGLLRSDYDLIGRSLHDIIVEPERSLLVPGFDEIKQAALEAGALGCSLSGSGPSIFALSSSLSTAQDAANSMKDAFAALQIASEIYVSEINRQGPVVIEG